MNKLAEGLYQFTQDHYLMGHNFGCKMYAVVDPTGVTLISPIEISPEIKQQIDELGAVHSVIAPNPFHHIYLSSCKENYPSAGYYAPIELLKKTKAFNFDVIVEDDKNYKWRSIVLDYTLFRPSSTYSEIIFYYAPTKELILTDLFMNFSVNGGIKNKLFLMLIGNYKKFGPTRLIKALLRDENEVKRLIEKVREWAPENIRLAHGNDLIGDAEINFIKKMAPFS